MRQLNLYKDAKRFLDKIEKSDQKIFLSIINKISQILENPLLSACKKLVGHKNLYRLRVDKYRIIYRFDAMEVSVLHIAKREDVYNLWCYLRRPITLTLTLSPQGRGDHTEICFNS